MLLGMGIIPSRHNSAISNIGLARRRLIRRLTAGAGRARSRHRPGNHQLRRGVHQEWQVSGGCHAWRAGSHVTSSPAAMRSLRRGVQYNMNGRYKSEVLRHSTAWQPCNHNLRPFPHSNTVLLNCFLRMRQVDGRPIPSLSLTCCFCQAPRPGLRTACHHTLGSYGIHT